MREIAIIALVAWVPVVLLLFAVMPPRRAVIVALLGGYLFLPEFTFPMSGLPDFSKSTATAYGLLAAVAIFDSTRLSRFRLSWIDLPIAAFIVVSIPTSLTNGLGFYDGATQTLSRAIELGIVWYIGRLYFDTLPGLRELAIGMFVGGLVYMPFCLYEIRMSPQLHNMLYGDHAHQFIQTIRFGGYRPTVFLRHGLLVGMFMSWATLCGIWLYATGSLNRLFNLPMPVLIIPLAATTVLCKSAGAIALLMAACAVLAWMKYGGPERVLWPLYAIAATIIIYIAIRVTGLWHGQELVQLAEAVFGGDRARSLNTRLTNERLLAEHAARQMLLGWGGWGRNRPGDMQVVTDSLWIIVYGVNGLVGLSALLGMFLLPPFYAARRVNAALWMHPAAAPVALFSTILMFTMLDLLLNSGFAPTIRAAAGGLAGFVFVRAVPAGDFSALAARMRGGSPSKGETPTQRKRRRRNAAKSGRKGGEPALAWGEEKKDAPS